MTTIAFKIMDILKSEFNEQQARKIAEVVDTAITNIKEDEAIATKLYVNQVEKDIKGELSEINNRLTKIETTIEALATKEELMTGISGLRNEMQNMRFDTIKWIIIVFSLNIVTIISAILAIVKFVAK